MATKWMEISEDVIIEAAVDVKNIRKDLSELTKVLSSVKKSLGIDGDESDKKDDAFDKMKNFVCLAEVICNYYAGLIKKKETICAEHGHIGKWMKCEELVGSDGDFDIIDEWEERRCVRCGLVERTVRQRSFQ